MSEERNEERLVRWDSIEVHLSGARLAAIAGAAIRERGIPVKKLELTFGSGELHVEMIVDKLIGIPLRLNIREIEPLDGLRIRIPLYDVTAFGYMKVPESQIENALRNAPSDIATYSRERNEIVIALARFVPAFVDASIEDVRIVPDGIAIRLGPGGADPPVTGGLI
jgi:hypothetical protein